MIKRFALIGACVLSLAACSTISELFPSVPNKIASLESTLAAAETAADAYVTLPRCGTPNIVLCSNPAVIKRIKDADNVAWTAIKAAVRTENQTELGAAQTAVQAFKDIVDSTGHGV